MPDPRHITLTIQNQASSGSDNFTNAIASDGSVYSYQYSETHLTVTHFGGDVSFTSRGMVTVTVKLPHQSPPARYEIDYVEFANDLNHQLRWTNPGAHDNAVIQNTNDSLQAAYYKLTIKDTVGNCTVPCDPMIINR